MPEKEVLNTNDFKNVMTIKKGSISFSPSDDIKRNITYYNTHGEFHTLKEFFDLEIKDRHNYEVEDLLEWMSKYALTPNTRVIWVTPDKKTAISYESGMKESQLSQYSSKDGTIILESDDGDNGYLYYYYEEYRLQCEKWKEIDSIDKSQYKTLDEFGKLGLNIVSIANSNGIPLGTKEIKGVIKYFKEMFRSDIEKLTENRPKATFKDLGYNKKKSKFALTDIFKEMFMEEKYVLFEIIRGGGDSSKTQPNTKEYVSVIIHELFEVAFTENHIEVAINKLLEDEIIVFKRNDKTLKKFKIDETNREEDVLEINEKYVSVIYKQYLEEEYRIL